MDSCDERAFDLRTRRVATGMEDAPATVGRLSSQQHLTGRRVAVELRADVEEPTYGVGRAVDETADSVRVAKTGASG
jgi:hypothetical protein